MSQRAWEQQKQYYGTEARRVQMSEPKPVKQDEIDAAVERFVRRYGAVEDVADALRAELLAAEQRGAAAVCAAADHALCSMKGCCPPRCRDGFDGKHLADCPQGIAIGTFRDALRELEDASGEKP